MNVCLKSPAKINLMLRILAQRADGYHELQTLFQLLDWGDEIEYTRKEKGGSNNVQIIGFEDIKTEDNLIYKAAQLLRPYAKLSSDWQIAVRKNIPQGAGLGGGSSNAATTLKFLNKQWQCDLNGEQLQNISTALGADVPLFVFGQSAVATGIGEKLLPMVFNTPYILLVFPGMHASTAELFAHKKLQRNQQKLSKKHLTDQRFWINDFFPLLLSLSPELLDLYKKLKQFGDFRLSGSGSTMYALYNDHDQAKSAMEQISSWAECQLVMPNSKKPTKI